jgi:hypothetical protein
VFTVKFMDTMSSRPIAVIPKVRLTLGKVQ